MYRLRTSIAVLLFCMLSRGEIVAEEIPAFAGTVSDWHGFQSFKIDVDGKTVTVVIPEQPATGRPWVWHGEFFGHKPDPDIELLKRGFHLVYMSIPNMLGSPQAVKHWDRCYERMTEHYKLAPKMALVGLSRGGLYCYNWAVQNPDKVACIYGDAPVCDFKSWPGGKGTGKGSDSNWKLVLKLWGFANEQEALAYNGNPVDRLKPLAEAGVPLLHVFGDADNVVPWQENTGIIDKRYRALGGSIQLIRKEGVNHHPHGLKDSTPIVEFILKHATQPEFKLLGSNDGIDTYRIESPHQAAPTKIFVLKPDSSNREKRHRMLFVMPVEAGEGTRWGNGLKELQKHDLHNKYKLICVAPTFSDLPWYADHPENSRLQQEAYVLETVLPVLRWQVPESRHDRDGRLLLGFSKSGWGAWSLLLRHSDTFGRAAAWDAPLMMKPPGKYGSKPIFGTEENFARYQLSSLVTHAAQLEFHADRLIHAGYGNFRSEHVEMNTLLESLKLQVVFLDGPKREHHWNSGWLPEVVKLLAETVSSNDKK